jgi:hypothetical protein
MVGEEAGVALAFLERVTLSRPLGLGKKSMLYIYALIYVCLRLLMSNMFVQTYNLALKALFSSFKGSASLGPTLSSVDLAGLPAVSFFFGAA